MSFECETREAIGDFGDLFDLLGNIVTRPEIKKIKKGHNTVTDVVAADCLTKCRIVNRGLPEFTRGQNVVAVHVGTRVASENLDLPWDRYTLNLGSSLPISKSVRGFQIVLPPVNHEARQSVVAPTLEDVPAYIEEVFMRGIGLFCIESTESPRN